MTAATSPARGSADTRLSRADRADVLPDGPHPGADRGAARPEPVPRRPPAGPRAPRGDRADRDRASGRAPRRPRGALVQRFGLRPPSWPTSPPPRTGREADDLAREAVAEVAAGFLADPRPTGAIAVSWGRTMLELSPAALPGWTQADGDRPAQRRDVALRPADPRQRDRGPVRATTGASIRLLPAPAIVGSAELRDALEAGSGHRETTLDAARSARRPRSSAWGSRRRTAPTSSPAS